MSRPRQCKRLRLPSSRPLRSSPTLPGQPRFTKRSPAGRHTKCNVCLASPLLGPRLIPLPDKVKRVTFADLGREPFRLFFPEGVLAGILGVMLWPLYFTGLTTFYPGQAHARIMAYGLFGGFIFGFLGTAMPRMLSVPPLGTRNVSLLSYQPFVLMPILGIGPF